MRELCVEPHALYNSKFKGLPLLPKTQRSHAALLWTPFTPLWRNEIRIYLNINAGAQNRPWRRFCVLRTRCHIYEGQWSHYALKCACVCNIFRVKNKIGNETNLSDCTSNLSKPKFTQTLQNSTSEKLVYRKT